MTRKPPNTKVEGRYLIWRVVGTKRVPVESGRSLQPIAVKELLRAVDELSKAPGKAIGGMAAGDGLLTIRRGGDVLHAYFQGGLIEFEAYLAPTKRCGPERGLKGRAGPGLIKELIGLFAGGAEFEDHLRRGATHCSAIRSEE